MLFNPLRALLAKALKSGHLQHPKGLGPSLLESRLKVRGSGAESRLNAESAALRAPCSKTRTLYTALVHYRVHDREVAHHCLLINGPLQCTGRPCREHSLPVVG